MGLFPASLFLWGRGYTGLDMGGKCPLGLPMQFVKDGLPVWIMSVVECVVLVRVIGILASG